jgi:hypothetical protein
MGERAVADEFAAAALAGVGAGATLPQTTLPGLGVIPMMQSEHRGQRAASSEPKPAAGSGIEVLGIHDGPRVRGAAVEAGCRSGGRHRRL